MTKPTAVPDSRPLDVTDLATAQWGAYIPAGTSVLDLDSIVKAHIQPLTTKSAGDATREVVAERYQWPLGGAMVAFFGVVFAGAGLNRPRGAAKNASGGRA